MLTTSKVDDAICTFPSMPSMAWRMPVNKMCLVTRRFRYDTM